LNNPLKYLDPSGNSPDVIDPTAGSGPQVGRPSAGRGGFGGGGSTGTSGKLSTFPTTNTSGTSKNIKQGEFSIINWNGYPKNGPKPEGTYRLLGGKEYQDARKAANNANKAIHKKDPSVNGKQIHEIKPVKFGGSPTDKANKIPLTKQEHAKYTTYWNNLMRNLTK
jgi:hypothetical protein